MVSKLKDGELAVVLTWYSGVKQVDKNTVSQTDLNLHVEFEPSDISQCIVDIYNRQCNGVKMVTDSYSTNG